jgi:NAD(P)-dependent dehydrogenase (short-subunit alcohol dehydrogenase family)
MKTYIITGAGSGMGRATAELLSTNSENQLVLIGRTQASLEDTLSKCQRPSDHFAVPLDVRNADEWKRAFQKIGAHNLNIAGVFANAGIGGENHYGVEDRWEEIISINLTGTYTTIMESLPYLRQSSEKFKHILITSSCLARFGVPRYTAYCTAKTGLLGLTRSLAVELASEKILVNALCPGWVDTEMARAGIQKLADVNQQSYEEGFKEQMSYVPLNRITEPQEIARYVKFLFSDEQCSITGQGLDINNGSFMI